MFVNNPQFQKEADSFYKEYCKYVPFEYDDVFVLHSNSGEAFLFLAYLIKGMMAKYQIQKPLIVATKSYHEDLIQLYCPKINYIYYDLYLKEQRLNVLGDYWESNGHRFWQIFSQRHFGQVNGNLGRVHYFETMLQTLELTAKDITKPTPKIPKDFKNSATDKIKKMQLDTDKFIILSPEASTCSQLSVSFWSNLVKELQRAGYDIFLNITGDKYKLPNCKTTLLTFGELYYLTTLAKFVISLKSVLSEYLLPTKTYNINICTPFHWSPLPAETCLSTYSVEKLPYLDMKRVKQICPSSFGGEMEMLKNILDTVKNINR